MEKKQTTYVLKMIFFAAIGLTAFMIPLPFFEGQTFVNFLSNFLLDNFDNFLMYFITILTWISTLLSIVCEFVSFDNKIDDYFKVKKGTLFTKIVASLILVILFFNLDIPIVNSADTGRNMLGLGKSLITISIALSYFLPLLISSGIMEFIGVITQDIVEPIFKVPGSFSIDLITSWFGASNAEVIMAREKYRAGYYSKRETAVIMCNFSLVSVSFVYIMAQAANLDGMFTTIFLVAAAVCVILAVIMPRIPPLSTISDEYYEKAKPLSMEPPAGKSKFSWGLEKGVEQSKAFNPKSIFPQGTKVMVSIWIELIPTVICWGTIGLILAYHTPVFQILSYPIAMVLQWIGLEGVSIAAPAVLVGFIDNFIPSILIAGIESAFTRFVILEVALVQMIYLTEVGAVAIQSDIGIDFKRLVAIFLERTIISFPIIYLIARFII